MAIEIVQLLVWRAIELLGMKESSEQQAIRRKKDFG
jgi:hypothetical protein